MGNSWLNRREFLLNYFVSYIGQEKYIRVLIEYNCIFDKSIAATMPAHTLLYLQVTGSLALHLNFYEIGCLLIHGVL